MKDIPKIEPDLSFTSCWHFTCRSFAVTHDIVFVGGISFYVPVCSYHKSHPSRGKIGMFTNTEIRYLKWFERIIRWLGKRAEKQ